MAKRIDDMAYKTRNERRENKIKKEQDIEVTLELL